MKDLRLFLEHRTTDLIKFKCEQTNKEINPFYYIYDKESLDNFINKYKLHKEQFKDSRYYFAVKNKNYWKVQTKVNYTFDVSRRIDKFLSSDKISYSYDDVISLIEDGDKMLVIFL